MNDVKVKKNDFCILSSIYIDKTYDIEHNLFNVLGSLEAPTKLINNNYKKLMVNNQTQIKTYEGKTKPILIERGDVQGAPLSPTLYNLSNNHILDDLTTTNWRDPVGTK